MSEHRFDDLARAHADGLTRRQVVKRALVGMAGLSGPGLGFLAPHAAVGRALRRPGGERTCTTVALTGKPAKLRRHACRRGDLVNTRRAEINAVRSAAHRVMRHALERKGFGATSTTRAYAVYFDGHARRVVLFTTFRDAGGQTAELVHTIPSSGPPATTAIVRRSNGHPLYALAVTGRSVVTVNRSPAGRAADAGRAASPRAVAAEEELCPICDTICEVAAEGDCHLVEGLVCGGGGAVAGPAGAAEGIAWCELVTAGACSAVGHVACKQVCKPQVCGCGPGKVPEGEDCVKCPPGKFPCKGGGLNPFVNYHCCPCPPETPNECFDHCCPSEQTCCPQLGLAGHGSGDCVDLQHDNANCGSCGNGCLQGTTCCSRRCTDLQTNVQHCGDCVTACRPGFTCQNGKCMCGSQATCPSGYSTCCANTCVDTQNDAQNCGRCGHACASGEICQAGQCTCGSSGDCSPGLTCCDGVCVDLQIDCANCGSCRQTCQSGQDCCNGTLISVDSDPANCGSCGHSCASGQTCQSSTCTDSGLGNCCPNAYAVTPGDLGPCADPSALAFNFDPNNCGGCGNVCTSCSTDDGYPCQYGSCVCG